MKQEAKLCKISDLVRLTGVSKQTIHYYLREGLLLPPVRSSKNMAYYNESTVDDIRFIKELQEKRYLPLAIIKEVLKARREGHDLGTEDHLHMMDQLLNEVRDGQATESWDEEAFLAETSLTKMELDQLCMSGIISPSTKKNNQPFDGFDVAIARALKHLMTMGMSLDDLKIYGDFLNCARIEAKLVHDSVIHRYPNGPHQPLSEIQVSLERVKTLLTAKAYREFLIDHHHDK
ncbi:MAG: MerR family transcriptional regulator [Candidatus Saccharibacteria bacterium]